MKTTTILASLAVALLASPALADKNDLSQSGIGNVAIQGHHNTGPVTTTTTGSYNPTATGGSATANGFGGSARSTSSSRSSSNSGSSADNSVTINGDSAQKRAPVSTAFAAPLVAADDTCMGSSSAGAQGVGFGLSLGSTWQDQDCVRRKDSRELRAMGDADAAKALLCQSESVAAAYATVGKPCPATTSTATLVSDEQVPVTKTATSTNRAGKDVQYVYPTGNRLY